MHQTSHTAEPYLYRVNIDTSLPISKSEVADFQKVTKQGVAIFGFTPNILVTVLASYEYWQTLRSLVSAMDTGKLAICTNDKLDQLYIELCKDFPEIEICIFTTNVYENAINWITA